MLQKNISGNFNMWINQIDDTEEYEGFVYRITEKDTGMVYFGIKKYFNTEKRPQKRSITDSEKEKLNLLNEELKEAKKLRKIKRKCQEELKIESKIKTLKNNVKKRISNLSGGKRKVIIESDWKTYNTSSPIMQEKLEKNPDDYEKEIIRNCKSVSELKAWEAYYQLEYYVRGDWDLLYNQMINLRLRIR